MRNLTVVDATRATVVASGRIAPHSDGRPARLVVLDTTGPAPVRLELIRELARPEGGA